MDPTVFAAILMVAGPFFFAMWVRLGHINGAVNNKDKHEPTLREVAVGTADVVVALAEKLGQLDKKVDDVAVAQGKQRQAFAEHTAQDKTNFDELKALAHMPSAAPVHVEVHTAPEHVNEGTP